MLNKEMYLVENLFDLQIKRTATRDGFGEGLLQAGEKNPQVVALCADLTESVRMEAFKKKFPERFIEVGVAEQNLAGIAAGLAHCGKIPFASSFGVFSPEKNLDQIRISICYSQANVKIASSHCGVTVGEDGASHQALEDIALMRTLPNMTVIVPCDALEMKKATRAAVWHRGPLYLRFGREKIPVFTTEKTPFLIGKAEVYREGKDVAIIACGLLVYEALLAAKELESRGISAMVINNHTIKPLDEKTILESAKLTGAMVTAEEHQIYGGMGSAIAEFLVRNHPVPMEMVGIPDRFGESGKASELLKKYALTTEGIVSGVERVLKRK